MKFSCEKALLSAAVATTSRAVAVKSSIPAMEGILIEADTRLRLTGYNLETRIQATVPAEIQEPGSLVLSARLFGEIIRKMPDDVVVFTANHYMVNIKCGLSEFNILGTDPEEFPELPAVDQQNSLTMEQSVLRSMIAQTLFAVSDNESRPIHTGSLKGLYTVLIDPADGYHRNIHRLTDLGEYLRCHRCGVLFCSCRIHCSDAEVICPVLFRKKRLFHRLTGNTDDLIRSQLFSHFSSFHIALSHMNAVRIHLKSDIHVVIDHKGNMIFGTEFFYLLRLF